MSTVLWSLAVSVSGIFGFTLGRFVQASQEMKHKVKLLNDLGYGKIVNQVLQEEESL